MGDTPMTPVPAPGGPPMLRLLPTAGPSWFVRVPADKQKSVPMEDCAGRARSGRRAGPTGGRSGGRSVSVAVPAARMTAVSCDPPA